MVVGESGLGKSTLINSMFLTDVYSAGILISWVFILILCYYYYCKIFFLEIGLYFSYSRTSWTISKIEENPKH